MKSLFINDDFDLEKIMNSGQCFRIRKLEGNLYRFISGDKVIYLKGNEPNFEYELINSDLFFWENYFDFDRNYKNIRKEILGKDPYLDKAINFSRGIRILNQEPVETLLGFILAQRKTIPSIINCVDEISQKYGDKIITPYETIYTFPSLKAISDIKLEELIDLKLGYRAKYFHSAIELIKTEKIKLEDLNELPTPLLIENLKSFYGVGDKIANCVALFSYDRLDAVPIDVWIERSIKENFDSRNPFFQYGRYAGLVQQYLFYFERNKP